MLLLCDLLASNPAYPRAVAKEIGRIAKKKCPVPNSTRFQQLGNHGWSNSFSGLPFAERLETVGLLHGAKLGNIRRTLDTVSDRNESESDASTNL